MSGHIEMTIHGAAGDLKGFRYFWAKYVTGFDETQHCAKSLKGEFSKKARTPVGRTVAFDEKSSDYVYVCGVSDPYDRDNNFHAALRYKFNSAARVKTYNGYEIEFKNAELLPIPDTPEKYKNKPEEFTTCRNFRFGAHYYPS